MVAVIAACAFVAFLRYDSRGHDPFIDLRFFRSIPFASATMIAIFCSFASWGAFLFMMLLYLQGATAGSSVLVTGLIYLPVAVGALIFSPLSGKTRRPIRQQAVTGHLWHSHHGGTRCSPG